MRRGGRRVVLGWLVGCVVCVSLVLAGGAGASAGRLRVCVAGPPTCQFSSIQSAIDAARAHATIVIAAGTYDEPLTVPGTGEATRLTLRGVGAGDTIIDGSGNGPVVTIGSGASVALSGVTISGGDALEEDRGLGFGGGIANDGSLTLSSSTVSDNVANTGGGIWNDNGAVVKLNNNVVSDNNILLGAPGPDLGGGIYNLGTMTLNNSTVSGNDAQGQATSDGGITNAGTMTLSKSTVSDNSSSQAVGGIDNESGGTMKLSDTSNRQLPDEVQCHHDTPANDGAVARVSDDSADWGGGV